MSEILKLKSGDDLVLQFEFADELGVPIDLTGKEVSFVIKERRKDSDAQAVYLDTWSTHTDPTNGLTEHPIPDDISKLWNPSQYLWQARIINADTTHNSTDVEPCEIQENLFDDA